MRLAEGRRTTVMLSTVVALPFLVSGLCAVARGWAPSWDTAFVQMRVLDVGSRHTPLVGLPSTVSQAAGAEIHHPGPAHFWLLAVPELVLRHARSGLALAQALVNATFAVMSVMAARSAAGKRAAWATVAGWLGAVWAMGDEPLHDPWNPHFAMIALLACAVCTAAFTHRRRPWIAAALVVAASCAAQTHLVALVPAVSLVVLAGVVTVRADGWRGSWPVARAALVGGALAWLGPIVDQVVHSPGNLRALLGGAGDTDPPFGPVRGFDRFARVLVPPGLLADGVPAGVHGMRRAGEWLVAFGLVALVAWGLRRRREAGRAIALHLVALVLAFSTWVGQAITPDSYSSAFGRHIWTLMWPAVLLVWAAALVTVIDRWPVSLPAIARHARVSVALIGSLVLLATVTTLASPLTEQRDGRWFDAIGKVSATVRLDQLGGSVVVRGEGITPESQLLAGVAADLLRQGVDVRLDGPISAGLVHPVHLGDEGATVLLVDVDGGPAPEGATEQMSRVPLLTPDGETIHVYVMEQG
jgi:hypothetical protein